MKAWQEGQLRKRKTNNKITQAALILMTEEEILVLPRAVKATKKSHLYTRLTLMLKLSRGTIN